jgi:translocation and assembly module TamB
VNLFVTRFTLARGYEQTATFTPSQGLDPELDIRLIASVAEVTRSRLPSSPLSSEINDAPSLATNLGALQTVRIQARATGPASQLVDNLELTSSPARSRTEIVALIGGGFIDTLGRGDSTLAIANLAGSALLTNIQDAIGNAIGASEFRLFPTTVIAEKSRTSTLGLGAEVGIDISRNFSASVLKVLTAEQPAQYNLRYRVNDKVLLRGSTDFSGDSRAVAEFEARF